MTSIGSSIPTYKYGSKEEVKAAKPKPQESPVPPQSPDKIYGKNFFPLVLLFS